MATDLTIPLDDELDAELNRLAQLTQRSKSDLAREMVRRELALARSPARAQAAHPEGEASRICD